MNKTIPKTIEAIYADYKGRRDALINALTDDADEFYKQCNPERENLCLYGEPDGRWRVDLPAEEIPPELPEPVLGINFARDGLERKDWLALCAVHADSWLMSVLFFYAVRFDDLGRAELFSLVNQHPTVYEVVTGRMNRNKMNKKRGVGGARAGGRAGAQQQMMQQQQPASVIAQHFPQLQLGQGVSRPLPTGTMIQEKDINPGLAGRQGELLWPDDGMWYLIAIQSVNLDTRKASVMYATGEVEELDLDEVLNEGHMRLL